MWLISILKFGDLVKILKKVSRCMMSMCNNFERFKWDFLNKNKNFESLMRDF